jgi:hypothetical protein
MSMNRNFHQMVAVAAIMLAGPAAAQSTAPQSPVSPLVGGNVDQNQGLSSNETTINRRAQDDALDRARETRKVRAVPAKPSDVTVGSKVSDIKGVPVGTIESVDTDGAVVVTAAGKAKLGFDTFGKNPSGLLIGVTKAQLDAAVAAANAKP